jgi:hypothetical protein
MKGWIPVILLLKEEVEISDNQTAGELFGVLSDLGAKVFNKNFGKDKKIIL